MLVSLAGQLAQLVTVISSLASAGSVITECGAETLESRLNVTGLVLLYTQAISWFVNVGLLPEQPEGPHSPIPLTQLQAQYREELSRIIQLLSWDRTIVFRSFFKYQIFSVFSIQHIFKTRIYSVFGIRSNFTIRDNSSLYWRLTCDLVKELTVLVTSIAPASVVTRRTSESNNIMMSHCHKIRVLRQSNSN